MNTTQPSLPGVHVEDRHEPAYQAYQILHLAFVAAPVIAGLDKFAQMLVNWDKYLAPQALSILGSYAHTFMLVVGVVEVIAGLIVALKPKVGAYIVAAWLAVIIADLVLSGHYLDVALRDFGLLLGALALGRLAATYDHQLESRHTARRSTT